MQVRHTLFILCLSLTLGGCVVPYKLVKAGPTAVAHNAFTVQPTRAWNMVPPDLSRTQWEEVWTQNGPLLETIAFLGGLPEGKRVIVQDKKAVQRVPLFRANMTPQDLASMVEASYRVRGVTV